MPLGSRFQFSFACCIAIAGAVLCFSLLTLRVGAANPGFATGVTNGYVNIYDISEASGLLISRQNPGVLWTHNDSGYRGSIFALTTNGMLLARHYVPEVYMGDFEDISSFGPGPVPGAQYIYLGDIGDNYLTAREPPRAALPRADGVLL